MEFVPESNSASICGEDDGQGNPVRAFVRGGEGLAMWKTNKARCRGEMMDHMRTATMFNIGQCFVRPGTHAVSGWRMVMKFGPGLSRSGQRGRELRGSVYKSWNIFSTMSPNTALNG